jgi:hypothetical protein
MFNAYFSGFDSELFFSYLKKKDQLPNFKQVIFLTGPRLIPQFTISLY